MSIQLFVKNLPKLNLDPVPSFNDFEEFIRLQSQSQNSKLADDWLIENFVKNEDGTKFDWRLLTFTQRMEVLKSFKNLDIFPVEHLTSDEIRIGEDTIIFVDPIGDYMYSLQEFAKKNSPQIAALKAVKDCYELNGVKFGKSPDANFFHGSVAYYDFLDRF